MPFQTLLLLVIGKQTNKKNSPFYLWSSKSYTINLKVFSAANRQAPCLSSAHACKLIGELNELLNVLTPECGTFTLHPTRNNHQPLLLLWINPSLPHPAELQTHPNSLSALHVSPWACSHPPRASGDGWNVTAWPLQLLPWCSVCVCPPLFTFKGLLGRLGESCHLKGLLCSLLEGWRGKRFYLRGFFF